MFTNKDIEYRTVFVINCIESRNLRVSNGELLLEEETGDTKKTLTKLPFQKILVLFVIGHIKVTTPFIEKCQKFNVALVVMKPNLRPVFFWANAAEANYLLRQRQHFFSKEDLSVAKVLMDSKISNQKRLLEKTRQKDSLTQEALEACVTSLSKIKNTHDYNALMGAEGFVSKVFFEAYFQKNNWKARKPRAKIDAINATLDIGYTILFNFVEAFARMFGFDVYVGVYHRLWFKRKSLICDLMEPFRCIIDNAVRNAYNRKQFEESDYCVIKNEYKLKFEKNADYYKVFFDALIAYKTDIFKFMQQYYRCFMRGAEEKEYPRFLI